MQPENTYGLNFNLFFQIISWFTTKPRVIWPVMNWKSFIGCDPTEIDPVQTQTKMTRDCHLKFYLNLPFLKQVKDKFYTPKIDFEGSKIFVGFLPKFNLFIYVFDGGSLPKLW